MDELFFLTIEHERPSAVLKDSLSARETRVSLLYAGTSSGTKKQQKPNRIAYLAGNNPLFFK